jgi:glycosyltransferase involved in cell wall biosynthesis
VDPAGYPYGFVPSGAWLAEWQAGHPMLEGRLLLLMPARLTRWKGQQDFIRLIARLVELGQPVHGLLVGEPHPKKLAFLNELKELVATLGVAENVSFLGHRRDLREIMAISALVYSLSTDPEAFGRVALEALALGKPVVGYNHGGVAEQLQVIFLDGRVPVGDVDSALAATLDILAQGKAPTSIGPFTLQRMLDATLEVYHGQIESAGSGN